MQAGRLRHRVHLVNPDVAVPDGDGGYTNQPVPLAMSVPASVEPATVQNLERIAAGTVISDASEIVTIRYLAGVTTKTWVIFGARTLQVTGTRNPEERNITLFLLCTEVVA